MSQRDAKAELQSQIRSMNISKPKDVEDLWDLVIHRPSAFLLLTVVLSFPKFLHPTPNNITYCSLGLGWTGALVAGESILGNVYPFSFGSLLGVGAFELRMLAAALMFASATCDCADGQLARATGVSSDWGRFLDGACDVLVIISYCLLLVFALSYEHGLFGLFTSLLAAISIQQSANLYDKTKSTYCVLNNMHGAEEVRTSSDQKAMRAALKVAQARPLNTLDDVQRLMLAKIAVWYTEGMKLDLELEMLEKDPRKVDRAQQKWTMRLCTFLATGGHCGIFYSSLFLSAFWKEAFLVYGLSEGIGFNILRYYVFRRCQRDKLVTQKEFFQMDMAWGVIGIGSFLVLMYAAGVLPSKEVVQP